MGGWFVDIFVEYIFRVFFHAKNLMRSPKWPIVKATVLSADCPHATYGCEVATVYYEYAVNGKKYGDSFGKPFIFEKSGEDYAALFVKGGRNVDFRPENVSAENGFTHTGPDWRSVQSATSQLIFDPEDAARQACG